MKTHIKDLAKKLNTTEDEILRIASEKVTSGVTGTGHRSWYDDAASELIELAYDVPLAIPTRTRGRVRRAANNPSYAWTKLDGLDQMVPVVVPRRLRDRMIGKVINVDVITDASNSVTYRYESHCQ